MIGVIPTTLSETHRFGNQKEGNEHGKVQELEAKTTSITVNLISERCSYVLLTAKAYPGADYFVQ